MSVLHINCLGTFQATLDGERLDWGRNEKDLAAYLAIETLVNHQNTHQRYALGLLLWPNSERPNLNFNKSWHDLLHPSTFANRHALAPFFYADNQFVCVNQENDSKQTRIELDAVAFNWAVDSRLINDWERGIALYRGEFLADSFRPACVEFELWLNHWRRQFHQQYINLLCCSIEHYLTEEAYESAEPLIDRCLHADPRSEYGYRLSMKHLALIGRRKDALAQYHQCKRMMQEEYDAAPSPETTTLYRLLQQSLFPPQKATKGVNEQRQPRRFFSDLVDPGILSVEPQGLSIINGYDLWFTSKATGRWQIWHLDSRAGVCAPITFDLVDESRQYHQYVPALSPDRKQIVFAAGFCLPSGRCVRNLFIANSDGTNTRRLTRSLLDEYHPVWYPRLGHQWLTYHAGISATDRDAGENFGIYVMDLATQQTRQLTNRMDYDPIWSPTGAYLAYHSLGEPHTIKVLAYNGEEFPCNQYPTWSAVNLAYHATSAAWIDEHALAFAYQHKGKWDIFRIPVDPSKEDYVHPKQLTCSPWHSTYPAVFDSRLLLWHAFRYEPVGNEGHVTDRQAELWVMDLAREVETPLITGIGNMRDGILVPHRLTDKE